MKRNSRSQRPVLEQIESRNLLATGLAGMHAPALVSGQPIQLIFPLDGAFHGRFIDSDNNPDVGSTFTASGSGRVRKLGNFLLNATLQTVGFIQVGPVQGTVVLRRANGTFTLELSAIEPENGVLGLPGVYSYTVVGGTGKYTNAVNSGTASLTTVVSKVRGLRSGVQAGRFELVLTSAF